MKIGILTHHYVNNFGAILQAYALQEALVAEFPNDIVEIINYVNLKQYVINSCGWFRFYKDRENMRCWLEKIHLPLTFLKSRQLILRLSPRCYTAAQINQQAYDVIIIGSDEVWNYEDKRSTAPIKFSCGLDCTNIIAYAPSVGNSNGRIPHYVIEGIKQFSAISVRDDMTSSFVEKIIGKKVIKVVDPTFLCRFPQKGTARKNKPYILFYYCDRLPSSIKNQILEYAKLHEIAVYGAGECDKRYSDITVNLTPFEWIDMFRHAEFVFTGTFHGVVFSILNHRQFKVYLTNRSRVVKVRSLLADFGLKDREIANNFVFDMQTMKNEIDYQEIDKIIANNRKKSLDFLRSVIKQST